MMFDTYFSTGRQNRSTAFVPPFCVTIKNSVISAGIFRIVLDGLSSRRYFDQRSFDMENLRMESLKNNIRTAASNASVKFSRFSRESKLQTGRATGRSFSHIDYVCEGDLRHFLPSVFASTP